MTAFTKTWLMFGVFSGFVTISVNSAHGTFFTSDLMPTSAKLACISSAKRSSRGTSPIHDSSRVKSLCLHSDKYFLAASRSRLKASEAGSEPNMPTGSGPEAGLPCETVSVIATILIAAS